LIFLFAEMLDLLCVSVTDVHCERRCIFPARNRCLAHIIDIDGYLAILFRESDLIAFVVHFSFWVSSFSAPLCASSLVASL
jgi:hypothetical protein